MRAASPTFGYGDLDLVELDERTPAACAAKAVIGSGSCPLAAAAAAPCRDVAYRDAIPRNEERRRSAVLLRRSPISY